MNLILLVHLSVCCVTSFKVVFDQIQIGTFSYEQAAAVTEEQLSALSDVQRTALAMVLTPWEDRPVDFRGETLKFFLSTNNCKEGLFWGDYSQGLKCKNTLKVIESV